jgi:lipopolysaccharide export system permease protein
VVGVSATRRIGTERRKVGGSGHAADKSPDWDGNSRRMKVAELYIARRTVAIFSVTLFWVILIVWTSQILVRVNLITSDGQSVATFFQVAGLVLPTVMPIVIPFAMGIAVAQTLASMNTDSELIVLTASGSPRSIVLKPILILATLAALGAFAVENFVEPLARERLRTLVADSRAELVTNIIPEGAFHEIEPGLVLQIAERQPDGGLAGVFLADSREEGVQLIYFSRRGVTTRVDGQPMLLLEDGTIQRRDSSGEVSSVRYLSYAFDMSEFLPSAGGAFLRPKDRPLAYLLNPDPNDYFLRKAPQQINGELHRRLTDWAYALVFAMIGLAVASDARSFRDARIHPLLTTMAIALVLRWGGFIAANEATSNRAFVPVMYAIPILSILGLAFMLATNRQLEMSTAASEKLQDAVARLHDRLTAMKFRLSRKRTHGHGGAT